MYTEGGFADFGRPDDPSEYADQVDRALGRAVDEDGGAIAALRCIAMHLLGHVQYDQSGIEDIFSDLLTDAARSAISGEDVGDSVDTGVIVERLERWFDKDGALRFIQRELAK